MQSKLFAIALLLGSAVGALAAPVVVCPPDAAPQAQLAAKEIVRYVYLRTGVMPAVAQQLPADGEAILLANAPALGAEAYTIRTATQDGRRVWTISGGSGLGELYGAYRFAEKLGVRFYLHGDVVPDERLAALPDVNEAGKPLFDTRGIQPFHDFPEGPDWWNQDDYLAYIGQLAKLRMNFLGLHCYPEGGVGPEPLVWIGLAQDLDRKGRVDFSYPATWANTMRTGMWGYAAMKADDFCAGANALFERDDYGPEVLFNRMPVPNSPLSCNQLFNDVGAQFGTVFAQAHALGVKTCIGTETPLTIPKLVQAHLKQLGKDPKDPAVVRELYEGMFRRIAKACPVDYYWLWTPENWTWKGNKPEELAATIADINAALEALNRIGKPFTLATCGWVLGPQSDRAALDKILPPECPMSCINREVGHAPDEPGFANVSHRPKWVIPWMENDPDLVAPQPWVGRMRNDAVDARLLGCTGLLGIHWRTKALAGNVAALAAAAWDQSWTPAGYKMPATELEKKADTAPDHRGSTRRDRTMPVADFYTDFARANFGAAVAESAGTVLAKMDGTQLPEPTTWLHGPGGIKIEKAPWSAVKAKYAFVEELAALRAQVQGAGNRERFDYWLNTYRAMAALAEVGCRRGELDRALPALKTEKDPEKLKPLVIAAVQRRIDLARAWERMIGWQVAATDTPGELGTLANLEQHSRKELKLLTADDAELEKAMGEPLPDVAALSKTYTGPARLAVPTVRTLAARNETLNIKVFALDRQPVVSVKLCWRPLGAGAFEEMPLKREARAVYFAQLKVRADVEYYIQAETIAGKQLVWPATAPQLNQTVLMWSPGRK
jgi:hypothetical protein